MDMKMRNTFNEPAKRLSTHTENVGNSGENDRGPKPYLGA